MYIKDLTLKRYYAVTYEMAKYYPDGSVVKELWKLQESRVISDFIGDVVVEVIPRTQDILGNNRPVVTVAFGYMFQTENYVYALTKEIQDFRKQVLLSVFHYIYPHILVIHDYAKVIQIIKEQEGD